MGEIIEIEYPGKDKIDEQLKRLWDRETALEAAGRKRFQAKVMFICAATIGICAAIAAVMG